MAVTHKIKTARLSIICAAKGMQLGQMGTLDKAKGQAQPRICQKRQAHKNLGR
jgi:hypothetical protein